MARASRWSNGGIARKPNKANNTSPASDDSDFQVGTFSRSKRRKVAASTVQTSVTHSAAGPTAAGPSCAPQREATLPRWQTSIASCPAMGKWVAVVFDSTHRASQQLRDDLTEGEMWIGQVAGFRRVTDHPLDIDHGWNEYAVDFAKGNLWTVP